MMRRDDLPSEVVILRQTGKTGEMTATFFTISDLPFPAGVLMWTLILPSDYFRAFSVRVEPLATHFSILPSGILS